MLAILFASLRLGPMFAFAPPFTLIRVPAAARATLVVAIAACLPFRAGALALDAGGILIAAIGELALGIAMALPLQLAFGVIAMAGRALDIQAGFGLAFLFDPKTKAQTPLIGALFGYAAAVAFFLGDGATQVVAIVGAGFVQVPVGQASGTFEAGPLLELLGTLSVLSLGLIGLAATVLFLIDLAVALMSRTMPQMNMLVFGFQVKAMATLLLLPATIGLAGAGIVRILRLAIEAIPGMAH